MTSSPPVISQRTDILPFGHPSFNSSSNVPQQFALTGNPPGTTIFSGALQQPPTTATLPTNTPPPLSSPQTSPLPPPFEAREHKEEQKTNQQSATSSSTTSGAMSTAVTRRTTSNSGLGSRTGSAGVLGLSIDPFSAGPPLEEGDDDEEKEEPTTTTTTSRVRPNRQVGLFFQHFCFGGYLGVSWIGQETDKTCFSFDIGMWT